MTKLRFTSIFVIIIALIATASFSQSCKQKEKKENRVSVSIPPLAYFAKEIGGDKVDVDILAPASGDPETFEPSIAQMRKLSDSKLFLITGLLPFENRTAQALGKGNTVVNLSDSINLIFGTHGDEEADPHIWASLNNALIISQQVTSEMCKAFPGHAEYFSQNLEKLKTKIINENSRIAAELEPCQGKSFLVWHPSLSYFARDYQLNQITLGEEHKEISINQLQQRINKVRQDSAKVFFYQKEMDSRQAQLISKETGLNPITITPLSEDIFSTINTAADAISSAYK